MGTVYSSLSIHTRGAPHSLFLSHTQVLSFLNKKSVMTCLVSCGFDMGVTGGHSNGIMSEREVKKRNRNRNNDDELENGYYKNSVTEERYRSMLGEHLQKYKRRLKDSSLSPAPARIPVSVPKSCATVPVAPKSRKFVTENQGVLREVDKAPDYMFRSYPQSMGNHYDAEFSLKYANDRYN